MYLELGDPHDDGHGKYDKILLESNVPVTVVQRAYKDSCKKTKISFNHNEDYTGENRHFTIADEYRIATEYDEPHLYKKTYDILQKFGLTENFPCDLDEPSKDGDYFLHVDSFVELWIWFVQLSNPKIKLKKITCTIPIINDSDSLDVQFGYGLYYS